jgi:type IV pilus assembly protein PilY1
MNTTSHFRKLTAIALSIALIGSSISAFAAPVVIADSPPLDINTVKPNLMFTLDTSGSMSEVSVPDPFAANEGRNCFKSFDANPLYFNPAETYQLPKSHNGASNTTTTLPDINYNDAPWDGFNTNATYRDDIAVAGTFVNTTARLDLRTRFRPDFKYDQTNPSQPRGDGYYMLYTGAVPVKPVPGNCYPDASYTRVSINLATPAVQNSFARWFTYYRSRMQAMKSAAGLAFGDLETTTFRVGFHNIWNTNGSFLNVLDFTGNHRQDWYTRFYASVPNNATPLRAATIRVGEYFRTGVMPGVAGSVDPVQQSCQPNFHLLSTDGYWNEPNPAFVPGNVDNVVPALPSTITGFTTGAPWPRPYRENPAAPVAPAINSPTLADIATYYWATNLRPAFPVKNVPTSTQDPADWQHVVMSGIAIAARGDLPYDTANSAIAAQTIADLTAGTRVWPHPTNLQPSAIDDLWHASVNSRGTFYNVNSAKDLSTALSAALADFSSRSASASGAALANANLSTTSIAYVPSYKTGEWTGDLVARSIDAKTGLATADLWSHAVKLDAQAGGTGWNTSRKLLTRANGNVVPFSLGSLTTAQAAALGSPLVVAPFAASEQQSILNYLRGDRSNEDQTAAASFKFRARAKLLGDITFSEPRAVAEPIETYSDANNPGYQAFRTAKANRTPMVYFGANDGFFHAVNGQAPGPSAPNAGNEMYAYMPSQLLRSGPTGIAALTYRLIDPPPKKFNHKYYVDGTPFSRDVDFSRTSQSATSPTPTSAAAADWRTVLIAGLGKGGTSYIALDVTTPPTGTESEAALAASERILWEFTDADMGLTYGKPAIVKTARYGWVALLPGGYNNISGPNPGKGIVYVVDVKTGTLLHKFITPDGDTSNPLGLAHLDAFVTDSRDYTATEIYAGDLEGNVWRFDISVTTPYSKTGIKFAQLTDGAGNKQPMTTYPLPYADPATGRRFVAIGTGKLLSVADLADRSQQTFYNLRDGSVFEPSSTGLPLTRSVLSAVARTDNAVDLPDTIKGWYTDLVSTSTIGERITKEAVAIFGVVTATSIQPSNDVCSRGGTGTFYARDVTSANDVIPGAATFIGGAPGEPPIVGVRAVKGDDGKVTIQLLTGGGTIRTVDIPLPGGFQGNVVNYREIIE